MGSARFYSFQTASLSSAASFILKLFESGGGSGGQGSSWCPGPALPGSTGCLSLSALSPHARKMIHPLPNAPVPSPRPPPPFCAQLGSPQLPPGPGGCKMERGRPAQRDYSFQSAILRRQGLRALGCAVLSKRGEQAALQSSASQAGGGGTRTRRGCFHAVFLAFDLLFVSFGFLCGDKSERGARKVAGGAAGGCFSLCALCCAEPLLRRTRRLCSCLGFTGAELISLATAPLPWHVFLGLLQSPCLLVEALGIERMQI